MPGKGAEPEGGAVWPHFPAPDATRDIQMAIVPEGELQESDCGSNHAMTTKQGRDIDGKNILLLLIQINTKFYRPAADFIIFRSICWPTILV